MSTFTVNLTGKSALVTGAGEGVGRAVALALGAAGARVMVNDLNPDRARKVAAEITTAGGAAAPWQADVSNKLLVGPMIEGLRDAYGKIDLVVNAAGVQKNSTLYQLDEWDWRRMLDVNLTGVFFVTQLAARVMQDEGGGVIVNITSRPQEIASKAAVLALTSAAAREFAPYDIRINTICPANIAGDSEPVDLAAVPMGRLGTPQEVAQVVLFLCSDAASFLTGQALYVDGGELGAF